MIRPPRVAVKNECEAPVYGAFLLKNKMPVTLTLGRNERLKSRKMIGRVFEEGKKLNQGLLRVHYLLTGPAEGSSGLQVAVTVSTKNFRKAADRNRVKRILREAWRLQKNELRDLLKAKGALYVFVIYTAKEIASFELVREDIRVLIGKLSSYINKTG